MGGLWHVDGKVAPRRGPGKQMDGVRANRAIVRTVCTFAKELLSPTSSNHPILHTGGPMTISIALKVGDGVVLGTDSASMSLSPDGSLDAIYVRCEKMLNLVRGLPVGLLAYGLGGLEHLSVARLARDLGGELGSTGSVLALDSQSYTLEEVSVRVWDYFHSRYIRNFGDAGDLPLMGFIVAGYSAERRDAEVWSLRIGRGEAYGPVRIMGDGEPDGLFWQGETEALLRLVQGASRQLYGRLQELGLSPKVVRSSLDALIPLWHPAMPIHDAIELVEYLAQVVVGFERFSPGIPLVTRPIDLAVITPDDGFQWLRRKQWARRDRRLLKEGST